MKRMIFTSIAIIIFLLLITIVVVNTYFRSHMVTADIIHRDIIQLKHIIERIDQDCEIQSFDYQQNRINFLNVEKFVGSEVGSLNLVYPEKWQGPYAQDNPTIQSIEYIIVRTDYGYFITPGIGVKLPNGKIIGKDIMVDQKAHIAQMIKDEKQLLFKDKELAIALNFGNFKQIPLEDIQTH